jgi:hypothetical protein
VKAINPRSTIGEFYSHVYRPCDSFDALRGACPSNGLVSMIVRVPGALLSTAAHVVSQGPIAVAIVGASALLFLGFVASNKNDRGILVHPFTWLVGFPLFAGLCAWGVQLAILLLLLMLKSFIASLAIFGIGYILFEKFKVWDDMRKLLDRGISRLTGRRVPQRAG